MDQLTFNPEFAEYLVATGACDRTVADEMINVAGRAWIPLGMILVREKFLRLKQIAKILAFQADDPHSLFGDVAVHLGFCTSEQIKEAMNIQRRECPHVLDLALDDARVDQDKLHEAMRVYIRYAERMLDRLSDALLECRAGAVCKLPTTAHSDKVA